MENWRNATGRPLSSIRWLEAHHRAKQVERETFAAKLAASAPKRVVDLGCATGLWLECLEPLLPANTILLGSDIDHEALAVAEKRAKNWRHQAHFELIDLDDSTTSLPQGDLILLFNVLPYINDPAALLCRVFESNPSSTVVIRQYDGANIRFGPLENQLRTRLDRSLQASVSHSADFRHYDLDRALVSIRESPFTQKIIEFELFQRATPFPAEFMDYFALNMAWTLDHVADDTREPLAAWLVNLEASPQSYWVEVDLIAVLS